MKTIAAAFTSRSSGTEVARLRDELDEAHAAIDESRDTLARQGAQLAELQERMDFAERLLAQSRDRAALRPGDQGNG